MKTLKELKAENADEATPLEAEATQAEPLAEVVEEAAEVAEEVSLDNANQGETEAVETEVEAWMQTEEEVEQGSEKEPKFTDSDIGKAKQKLRAKMEKKHESELDDLKAQIEALKTAPQTAPIATNAKPKREDFYDADDPDDAFVDALTDWKLNNKAQAAQQQTAKSAQEQQLQAQLSQIEGKVDEHYTRAAQLAKTSGISEDVYRQADMNVRQAVESVMPNAGDSITDGLISKIGDDSEKVMYYLGRNKAKLGEFERALRGDPSGIEAAMLLGEIKRDLTAPTKRKSNAPTPAPTLSGDENSADKAGSWKRKYNEASKQRNAQKSFDIKREAKKAGVNTRDW